MHNTCDDEAMYKVRRYGPEPRPLTERFWRHVRKTDDCWLWLGGPGYGRLRTGGKGTPLVGPHRLAWELAYGPVPDGLIVCHRCDNPRCVRPDHLFVGTHGDNARDRERKGRGRRGRRPPTVAGRRVPMGGLRIFVLARDRGCFARREPGHVCEGPLSLEHVLGVHSVEDPRRDDERHCTTLCLGLNGGGSIASHRLREEMRDHLRRLYPTCE